MRRLRRILSFLLAGALSVSPASMGGRLATTAEAAVPYYINYQGRLTDSTGAAVIGALSITFRLYTADSGGSAVWSESHSVSLAQADEGVFNVVLGNSSVLTSVDFNTPLWLGVQVSGDTEMTPRQRVTASSYALNADKMDGLDSTSFLRTDVDTSTSGKLTITRSGLALFIKPTTDPEADTKLIDVQNAAGTSKFSVDIEGDAAVAGNLSVTGTLTTGGSSSSNVVITNPSSAQTMQPTADVIPLTIKGLASGTAKVLSIYDAAATPAEVAFFNSAGQLRLAKTSSAGSPALVISSESSPAFSTATATQFVLSQATGGTDNFIDAQVAGASKFLVDASGNMTIAGTMSNTGASTLSSLTVTGQADLQGNVLDSTGNLTLADAVDVSSTLAVTGATTLSSTLAVTGATTLSSTLGVTGAATLSSTLAVTGAGTFNGDVTLGDASADTVTVNAGPVNFPSATEAADGLVLGGDANLYRSAADTLKTDDALTVAGAATLSSTLGVTGDTTLSGDLAVNGDDITGDSNLAISAAGYVKVGDTGTPSNATADDDLYVQGNMEVGGTIYGSLSSSGSQTMSALTVTGQTDLQGNVLDTSGNLTLADAVDISGAVGLTKVNAAGGSADALTLSGTLSAMNGSDAFRGVYLNYANGSHTGASNTVTGVDIAALDSASSNATEYALQIGSGWDRALSVTGTDVFLMGATDTVTIDGDTTDIAADASKAMFNLDLGNTINTTGTLTQTALDIDLTNANHTGGTTNLYGVDLQITDADAAATSNAYGVNVGSNFDYGLYTASAVVNTSTANLVGAVSFGNTSGGTAASLILYDSDATSPETITVAMPSVADSGSFTLTLPTSAGSNNQVLKTDGNGALAWATVTGIPGAGDVTDVGTCDGGSCFTDGTNQSLVFEGSSADDFEITLSAANPSADATVTIPATTGTIVTTGDSGTVTSTMIAADTIAAVDIATDGVGAAEIAADAVGTSEIATDGVGTAEIAADAVGASEIAADAVGTSEIATDGVGAAEIAAGAVGTSEIADASIVAADVGSFTLDDAFDDGKTIDGANSSANAMQVGDGTDDLLIYTTGSAPTIATDGTSDLTIAPDGSDVNVGSSTAGVDLTVATTGADELSSVTTSNTSASLAVATNPGAAGDSDGVIKLGKQNGNWEYIQYDASARSGSGQFIISNSMKVLGSSPSVIEFDDASGTTKTLTFDSTADEQLTWDGTMSVVDLAIEGSSPAGITFGSGSNTQTFSFDPNAGGEFTFSGGVFTQQFRNMVRNGSFEAFSSIETFATSSATGVAGGAGSFYYGGWQNFSPDEWQWQAGEIFQHAPTLYTPGMTITATNLRRDYYHGKSAVTLRDMNVTQADTYNDTTTAYNGTDARIEQTIGGLKPSTVYSVGVYMLAENSAGGTPNAATQAILDIAGEEISSDATVQTTLRTALTSASPTVETANATDISQFPDSGVLLIENELISYAGKDNTNHKFTFCIRGFGGTTAAMHALNTTVKLAPFQHLTTLGSTTVTQLTLYKGQFATDSRANDVRLSLICKSAASGDQCRFDAVQIVEGRSITEFQPSAIVDTGDQTLYGSIRMGRTSDGRGGILSVDKSVRTRAIEFFEKDPGISGTVGGMGGVGSATKMAFGATSSTETLTTGGSFYGTNPRDTLVTITQTAGGVKFKWEYRECFPTTGCSGTYALGGDNLNLTDFISLDGGQNPLPGSMGVKLMFANTGTAAVGDQWNFHVSGMNMASQYNSYSATATYQPGETRIYKDPFTGKLMFQDSTTVVSLQDIAGAGIAMPARVDPPMFFSSSTGGGSMWLNTTQGYTPPAGAPSPISFDIQICAEGPGTGYTRDKYQWRDNIQNGGQGSWEGWDGSCAEIPASGAASAFPVPGGGGATYGFTITFGSPAGTWQDARAGDRWQVMAFSGSTTTTVKVLTGLNGVQVTQPANPDARDVSLKLNSSGPGLVADNNGLSLLRSCASNEILKWSSGTSTWVCSGVSGVSGASDSSSTTSSTYTLGSGVNAASSDVTLNFGSTSPETIKFAGTGATAAADVFEVSDSINIPSGEKYKINGADLNFSDLAGVVGGGVGGQISDGTIINDDISATAAIADTKLAIISTAGKVSGSAVQLAAGSGLEDATGLRIGTAAAGNGLGGGGGAALAVNVDNSTVELSADALRVKASGIGANEIATGAVTSAEILDGDIANVDVSAGAAIAGTKISPDFGTQDVVTSGYIETPFGGVGRYENLIFYSEDFMQATWTKSANTSISATNVAAPDSTTNADTVAFAAVAGTDTIKQAGATAAASNQFTASVWLKAATAQTVRLGVIDQAGSPAGTYSTINTTSSWQRYSVTHTFAAGAIGNAVFILDDNGVAGAVNVDAWGAQLEQGVATPSVYTRTTSETRNQSVGVSVNQNLHVSGDFEVEGIFTQHVSTNDQTMSGNLVVNGNATLGDTNADTVTVNAGPINLPSATTAADALVLGVDTNLYRSAIDTLKTDDAFAVGAGLTVGNGLTVSTGTVSVPAGEIGTTEIADNAISGAKIAMGGDAKGDLLVYNGTDYVRVAVGANDLILIADSAAAGGVKWAGASTVGGDINGVTAGTGLTGGGGSGEVTLNIGAGTGMTINADDIAIDTAIVPRLGVTNTFTSDMVVDTTGADELASVATDASTALAIATNASAAGDADGVLKLGKDNGAWQYLHYDASLRSNKGQFVFSKPVKVLGDGGAANLEFEDSTGGTSASKVLSYDKSAGTDGQGAFVFGDQIEVPTASPAYMSFKTATGERYAWKLDPDATPISLSMVKFASAGGAETPLFRFKADGAFGVQDPTGVIQDIISKGGKMTQQFQNLIRGGSFESIKPTGWQTIQNNTFGTKVTLVSAAGDAKFGSKALSIQDDTTTAGGEGIKYTLPNSYRDQLKGKNLTISGWARADAGQAKASMGISTDGGSVIYIKNIPTDASQPYLTTTYQQFTVTFAVPANAGTMVLYLYGAEGTEPTTIVGANKTDNDGAGGAYTATKIYFDGLTMAEGSMALDFGPAPVFDTGDQVIYGNLAIGANVDPYTGGQMATLTFGEPDSTFGTGYGGYGMGSGSVMFQQWGGSGGRFRFNRGLWVDDGFTTGGDGGLGASLNVGGYSSGGTFSDKRGDAFIRGRMELQGEPPSGVSYASPATTLIVGSTAGSSVNSANINNATSAGDAYIKGNLEVDGVIYGTVSGSSSVTGTSNTSFIVGSATNASTTDVTLQFGNTSSETITFAGSGASAAADVFNLSDSVSIPTGEQYLINGAALNFSDLAGTVSDTQLAAGAVDGGLGGEIADGTITNDDLSATAAIAGTKIAPDFGAQNITTTGKLLLPTQSSTGGVVLGGDAELTRETHIAQPALYTPDHFRVGGRLVVEGSYITLTQPTYIGGAVTYFTNSISPSNATSDLGGIGASPRWRKLYVTDIDSDGTLASAGPLTFSATPTIQTAFAPIKLFSDSDNNDTANLVQLGGNGGTAYVTLSNAGFLGIGTAAPQTQLELTGSLASPFGGVGRYENMFVQSEALNTTWTATGATVTANPAGANPAPEGSDGVADEVDFGATAANRVTQPISLSSNTAYVVSFWAKAAAGTPKVRVVRAEDGAANTFSSDLTLSTAWQRYSAAFTTGTVSGSPYVGLANGSTGTNDNIYVWGLQLEAAATPGVYAKTTTTAVTASKGLISSGDLLVAGSQTITGGQTVSGDQNITGNLDVTGTLQAGSGNIALTTAAGYIADGALEAGAVDGGPGGEIADGTITNDDLSATAAIADTKLATISTAGKVTDSALPATLANKTLSAPSVTGQLKLADGSVGAPALAFSGQTNTGFYRGSIDMVFAGNGVPTVSFGITGFDPLTGVSLGNASAFAWSSSVNAYDTEDLRLYRDAAGILAQRNGTSAQEWRLYNTDAATDEFVSLGFQNTANVFTIQTEQVGGATVRPIALMGGNVGIGTTNPAGKLDVAGAFYTSTGALSIRPEDAVSEGGQLEFMPAVPGYTNSIYMDSYLGGGYSSTGRLRFFSNNRVVSLNFDASPTLQVEADGPGLYGTIEGFSIIKSAGSTDLNLQTVTTGNILLTPAVGGNVGIGTSSPAAKLHVAGGAMAVDADQKMSLESAPSSGDSYMQFNSSKNYISFFVNGLEVARLKQ